jgi:hypothetical protein
MKPKQYPSQAELRALFDYKDGQLIRNGKTVGTKTQDGYLKCTIKCKTYLVHRLIYIYHHGSLSTDLDIDHINHNKQDNRIENIRAVTRSQNNYNYENSKGYTRDNRRNNWYVRIGFNKKRFHIGSYFTECGARLAYLNAKLGRTLYGRSYFSQDQTC